jgi:hypothetical protein
MFRTAVGKNAPALDAKEADFLPFPGKLPRQIGRAMPAIGAPLGRLGVASRDPDMASNILVNCAALH